MTLFLALVVIPPCLLATESTTRSSNRSILRNHPSAPKNTATQNMKQETRPVPLRSNLAIKAISAKKCTLFVTLANSGRGPVSRSCRAKGTLTLTFSPLKAADRKLVPKTFSASLAKLDHGHILDRHNDLIINTRIRVSCPLTVTARLSRLSDDDGRGPRLLTKRINPEPRCRPQSRTQRITTRSAIAKPSTAKIRAAETRTKVTAATPARSRTQTARLTTSLKWMFDLSIVRAYVRSRDRHLHIVLENKGKTSISPQALQMGRLDIRVIPRQGKDAAATPTAKTVQTSRRLSSAKPTDSKKFP